jgi:hypothetical protein
MGAMLSSWHVLVGDFRLPIVQRRPGPRNSQGVPLDGENGTGHLVLYAMRYLVALLLCVLLPGRLGAQRAARARGLGIVTVEAIPVAEVLRILDGHGRLTR